MTRIRRQEFVKLVGQAKNVDNQTLKNLSQLDRRTLRTITQQLKEQPDIAEADIDEGKFESLKARLSGQVSPIGREGVIKRLFLRLTGQYIHTEQIRGEVEEAFEKMYSYVASSKSMFSDDLAKNAPHNYMVDLRKIKDNTRNEPDEKRLERIDYLIDTLKGVIAKVRMASEVKNSLDFIRIRAESFKKELSAPPPPPPLKDRAITLRPEGKTVRFADEVTEHVFHPHRPIAASDEASPSPPPVKDKVSKGDPTQKKFLELVGKIRDTIKEGHIFKGLLAVEMARRASAARFPAQSAKLGQIKKSLLRSSGQQVTRLAKSDQITEAEAEAVRAALDLIGSEDAPVAESKERVPFWAGNSTGKKLESAMADKFAQLAEQAAEVRKARLPEKPLETVVFERTAAARPPVATEAPIGASEPDALSDGQKMHLRVKEFTSLFSGIGRNQKLKMVEDPTKLQSKGFIVKDRKPVHTPKGKRHDSSVMHHVLDQLGMLNTMKTSAEPNITISELKDALDAIANNSWARRTIDSNKELNSKFASLKGKIDGSYAREESLRETRTEHQAVAEKLEALPLQGEGFTDILVRRMTDYPPEVSKVYEERGIVTPSSLLMYYPAITSTENLLDSAVLALKEDSWPKDFDQELLDLSQQQKLQVLEFCTDWIDYYGDELVSEDVQQRMLEVVWLGENSSDDAVKQQARSLSGKVSEKVSELEESAIPSTKGANLTSTAEQRARLNEDLDKVKDVMSSFLEGKLDSPEYYQSVVAIASDISREFAKAKKQLSPQELLTDPVKAERKGHVNEVPNILSLIRAGNNGAVLLQKFLLEASQPPEGSPERYAKALAFVYDLGGEFAKRNDFEGLQLVLNSLSTASMAQLEKLQLLVDDRSLKEALEQKKTEFKKAASVLDASGNYKKLRARAKEIGAPIPMFLAQRDRTFFDEANPTFNTSKRLMVNGEEVEGRFPNLEKARMLASLVTSFVEDKEHQSQVASQKANTPIGRLLSNPELSKQEGYSDNELFLAAKATAQAQTASE